MTHLHTFGLAAVALAVFGFGACTWALRWLSAHPDLFDCDACEEGL